MAKKLCGSIFLILAAHLLATYFFWYYAVWWLDIPMHIATGAWVAILFLYIFFERKKGAIRVSTIAPFLFLLVGAAAIVGILWEIYEFGIDVAAGRHTFFSAPGYILFDTLKDLIDDIIGASFASVAAWFSMRRKIRS